MKERLDSCLAGIRIKANPPNRTFYRSEIWVNILYGCYKICFRRAIVSPNFKGLNPYNLRLDHVQCLQSKRDVYETVDFKLREKEIS